MSKICKIDDRAFNRLLDRLDEENRKKAIFKSLKKGGEILVERSKSILRNKMPNSTKPIKKGDKIIPPIVEGIHISKLSDKEYLDVLVTVLGQFMTKWFETGTKERFLKRSGAKDRSRGRFKGDKRYWYRKKGKENQYLSGTYRGKIEGLGFFEEARIHYDQEIVDNIIEFLEKEIERLMK